MQKDSWHGLENIYNASSIFKIFIMNQEYIGKTPYAGFWVLVREVWTNPDIMQNQAIFWGKIFEVLWHGETVEELKETWWDAFWEAKIYYFNMEELTYRDEARLIIRYKILSIIETEKKA